MHAVPVETSPQFIPLAITVAVGVLSVAFAVIRRVQRSGDNEVTARRFPPRQAPLRVMAVIAALAAVTTGLALTVGGRGARGPAQSIADSLSVASDSATKGVPMIVLLSLGVVAVVVVILLKLRNGDR